MKLKKLNRIGNSFGIIIDKTVLQMLNIDVTERVCLSIENGKIIIQKTKEKGGKE
jgi:antitoxin component of MazEF toxin-antitoxin module